MEKSREPEPEVSRDEFCGLGSWRPKCLQRMANHRIFVLSYVIIGVVQGMTYSYFNGVLTTIEKAFGIQSSSMGFILSGNDISQILCGILITYIAGRGSRPLWLAIGMMVTAATCFIYAAAQLIWDGQIKMTNDTEFLAQSHSLCSAQEVLANLTHGSTDHSCDSDSDSTSVSVLVMLFAGQFISGVGSTTIFTLGLTYMDDSVKKSASPLYLAITSALRSLGPTLGYVMASMFLKMYINPQTKPEYSKSDPRWLGAWWLGFLVIGVLKIVITIPMLLFPKQLPTRYRKKAVDPSGDEFKMQIEAEPKVELPSFQDFLATMGRIIRNPLIVLHVLSVGPIFLGIIGYTTFLPKYLEANFGQTSSQSSLISGTAGTMMMMFGVFIGGVIIWKFKPSAFTICIASGAADAMYALGLLVVMNFKCDSGAFVGVDFSGGSLALTSNCSRMCDCAVQFDPICLGSENYLSPCSAGCMEMGINTNGRMVFKDCACAPAPINTGNATLDAEHLIAKMGYCPGSRSNCSSFWSYIIILACLKFIMAGTKVGGVLVFIRSMEPKDKSVAMALSTNVMSLLGFIPGPIVYGAIADHTCMLWETTACGQRGNCWLYNLDELRPWYHGVTVACFLVGCIFEFLTAIYARKLNLYGDDPPSQRMTFREGLRFRPKIQTQASVASGLEIMKAQH